ncbi:putative six-bladed beta-propeller, TolB [Helianthus anomalus]
MVVTDSRPKNLVGSPEGLFGHVDGKPRESRMNHSKGLRVDDKGNVYVADTMNMAIRKITDTGTSNENITYSFSFVIKVKNAYFVICTGVVTIAGGNLPITRV